MLRFWTFFRNMVLAYVTSRTQSSQTCLVEVGFLPLQRRKHSPVKHVLLGWVGSLPSRRLEHSPVEHVLLGWVGSAFTMFRTNKWILYLLNVLGSLKNWYCATNGPRKTVYIRQAAAIWHYSTDTIIFQH